MYVGMRYRSRVAGAVVKAVTCEECGAEYVYVLEREGRGEGSSPYFLDKEGAQNRAANSARKDLERRLEKECDVAPCPKCGRIQEHMVRMARKRRLRWLFWVSAIVGGLGIMLMIVNLSDPHADVPWSWIVLLLAAGALPLVLRFAVVSAFDPNHDHVESRLELAKQVSLSREEFERRAKEAEQNPPPAK